MLKSNWTKTKICLCGEKTLEKEKSNIERKRERKEREREIDFLA